MKKPIYIIGAGGGAKESWHLIQQINQHHDTWNVKGFVDINPNVNHVSIGNKKWPIIQEKEFLKEIKNVAVTFSLGDVSILGKAINKYPNNQFEFPNLIHPDVSLNDSISLGKGNSLCQGVILTVDITIGDFNFLNRTTQIGHDSIIGNMNALNPGAILSGGSKVCNLNTFGMNSSVLQYLAVGNNNTIGAGAVLTKSIDSNQTMVGIPAKPIL